MIQCGSDDKVSDTIDRYRSNSGNFDPDKEFIFNEKPLNPDLTLSEAGISNYSNIYVVSTKNIKKKK